MSDILQYQVALDKSATASEALAAYVGVVINSDGELALPASAGDRIDGITLTAIAAGEEGRIIVDGMCPVKVKTASGLAKNSIVAFNTDGGAYLAAGSSGAKGGAVLNGAPSANGDVVSCNVSRGLTYTF
jgi:predicted RecA/RadA family phage recombinase